MSPIINIKKGGPSVPGDVIERAKIPVMTARGWPTERLAQVNHLGLKALMQTATPDDLAFVQKAQAALVQFEADLTETLQINAFNAALEAYRAAQARLARVRLSVGQAAVYEDRETGEFDEQGQPIIESVLVSPEVPPLVAEDVDYPVYDEEGQQTGTVTEPDRDVTARIEADEAEREAAQAVVDGTPQEVREWQG